MTNEQLSRKDQLYYSFVGVGIGIVYVIFFILITGTNLDFIIPMAFAQVQPFELQLEQIRNPEACTRKVFQSSGAYIPFTLKVFYDTTQDRSWDVISKAETFPVAQQTAQVATFFTQEVDQYEVHLEVNYDKPKKRQAYIEILSEGRTVTSWQEKFDDDRVTS